MGYRASVLRKSRPDANTSRVEQLMDLDSGDTAHHPLPELELRNAPSPVRSWDCWTPDATPSSSSSHSNTLSETDARQSITDFSRLPIHCTPAADDDADDLPGGPCGHFPVSTQTPASHAVVRFSDLRSRNSPSSIPNLLPHSAYIPPYIDRYWDLMKARSIILQKAAASVRFAGDMVYGEASTRNSQLMISALRDGLIPHQPQATPSRILRLFGVSLQIDVERLTHLAFMLPGFHDFAPEDQKILLTDKYLVHQSILNSRFFYKGEYYMYMNGPDGIHLCQAMADLMGFPPDFMRFIGAFQEKVNDIGLTLTETYLLSAAAIFTPDIENVSNRALVAAQHAFYLDALFYQFGHRLNIADRAIASAKVERVVQLFSVLDRVSAEYVRNLDLSTLPVRSRCILFAESGSG